MTRPDRYTPEQRREYMRGYYAKRLEEAKAVLGGGCVECGATDDLEFDHIDPQDKNHAITKMLMWAKAKWLEELEKCQLLCQGCHARKTSEHIKQGLIVTGGRAHKSYING